MISAGLRSLRLHLIVPRSSLCVSRSASPRSICRLSAAPRMLGGRSRSGTDTFRRCTSGSRSGRPWPRPAGGLSWSGEVPPQKWMNSYTKVLSRFATGQDRLLTLRVEFSADGGITEQHVQETKVALRELGVDDESRCVRTLPETARLPALLCVPQLPWRHAPPVAPEHADGVEQSSGHSHKRITPPVAFRRVGRGADVTYILQQGAAGKKRRA